MAHQAITRTSNPQMTDDEFDRYVMGVLARELGPVGFARYLSLHRSGPGDYTRDRHQWLGHLTLEDIWHELEAQGGAQSE